ncbi:MAG: thymidine kinase [Clostridiales bacterium]|nr:thymidine kinase [Clostridiales bacterium]
MAKLYYRYGAMGSSKTANAIMVQYNYMERGQKVLMLKPKLENRDGASTVKSRCGLETECLFVEDISLEDVRGYDCVIVDEAQFLSKERVQLLVRIVDELDIPVICYGLRTDFQENFFEGSMWLMAWADSIEEVKTICWCGRKAICNARVVNGKVVKEGDQILLGGSSQYVSLCRKHFHAGDLGDAQRWGHAD